MSTKPKKGVASAPPEDTDAPASTSTAAIEVPAHIELVDKLACYWLSRDRIGGVLMEIDVWAVAPERVAFDDGDVMWLEAEVAAEVRQAIRADATYAEIWAEVIPSRSVDATDACIDAWTVAEAKHRIGSGAPDTDRECTRVGEPLPVNRALLS